jgi:hypothetical protein
MVVDRERVTVSCICHFSICFDISRLVLVGTDRSDNLQHCLGFMEEGASFCKVFGGLTFYSC